MVPQFHPAMTNEFNFSRRFIGSQNPRGLIKHSQQAHSTARVFKRYPHGAQGHQTRNAEAHRAYL